MVDITSSIIAREDLLGIKNFNLSIAKLLLDDLHSSVSLVLLRLGDIEGQLIGSHDRWFDYLSSIFLWQ